MNIFQGIEPEIQIRRGYLVRAPGLNQTLNRLDSLSGCHIGQRQPHYCDRMLQLIFHLVLALFFK
jgi:hypothetical protein